MTKEEQEKFIQVVKEAAESFRGQELVSVDEFYTECLRLLGREREKFQ